MRYRISDLFGSTAFKLIIIAIFLRLLGVTSPYVSDESMWSETVKYMHQGNFDPMVLDQSTSTTIPPNIGIFHPPLAIISYFINTYIFGVSPLGMRLVPLFFSIGAMCVTYFLSRRMYDQKTAVLTLVLMAFSFYSVWSSLYLDIDGAILLFFVTSTVYCYMRFREAKEDRALWLRLAAISFGLALLTKYTALLFIPILLLAEFLDNSDGRNASMRKIIRKAYPVMGILFVGLLIFSIFPTSYYVTGRWSSFIQTFSYGKDTLLTDTIQTQVHSLANSIMSFSKNIFLISQYATPIIPALAFISLRNRSGKEKLFFLWIAIFLLFYTFLVPGGGKIKYLMILIPPLYILAARGLLGIADVKKNDAISLALMSVIFLGIIAAFNMYGSMEPFNTNNLSTQPVLDNGFLWYSGHGSSAFAIHIHSFIFVVVFSAILFVASFRKGYFRNAMLALLALGIAFNGFILSESFNPTVGPDYKETLQIIAADYRATEGPMYGITQFRNALNIYFGSDRLEYADPILERNATGNLEWSKPKMKGKVIVIDAQLIDHPLFKDVTGKYLDEKCRLEKTYYSNNYPFGYVYNC